MPTPLSIGDQHSGPGAARATGRPAVGGHWTRLRRGPTDVDSPTFVSRSRGCVTTPCPRIDHRASRLGASPATGTKSRAGVTTRKATGHASNLSTDGGVGASPLRLKDTGDDDSTNADTVRVRNGARSTPCFQAVDAMTTLTLWRMSRDVQAKRWKHGTYARQRQGGNAFVKRGSPVRIRQAAMQETSTFSPSGQAPCQLSGQRP